MINITVPRLYASDFPGGWTRLGDSQIIGRDVIDGGCDKGAVRTIAVLKARKIRDPWLHITHGHYDHRDCADKILSDPWFTPKGLYCQDPNTLTAYNSSIRSDINALKRIIQKAKDKGVPVFYLGNDQQIKHGDLEFTVYRAYPKYTGDSDEYLNEGSLCYWFPKLRYLTTGDASLWCAYKYNLDPLIIKCGHHGNDASAGDWLKPSQMTVWLVKRGCKYYWDNDFSTHLTDFLMTGREDAINAGMIILNVHSDITMNFALGKVTIMNNGKTYIDSVPYDGKCEEGWVKNHKGWWYRFSDGTWAVGWKKLKCAKDKKNGLWFYFGADGYMATGWQKVNGKWYYLDPAYGDMKTGWIYVNGIWYYLEESGAMKTGWMDWKGKKCYLDPANGHCLVSCTRVIDGKTYCFDKGGYAEEVSGAVIDRSKKFIDISEFQGDVDWSKAAGAVGAVYIRCGLRGSLKNTAPADYKLIRYDRKWTRNLAAVQKHGVPFSAYYFPTAINDAEALEGAKWFYEVVKDLNLAFPPALDSENVWGTNKEAGRANGLSKSERTRLLKIVTDYFNARGMNIGIYASASWLNSKVDMSAFPQCVRDCTWVADSTGAVDYNGYYWLHQYGKGACAGFGDDVDLNRITGTIPHVRTDGKPQNTQPAKPTEDPVDVLIRIMEAEVGTHEGPNNKTKYGDEMHALQPSNMDKNAAWCDSFFDWCILKLCEYFGYGADMARMVLCGDFDDYTYNSVALYKKAGRWSNTPHRGDQIFFGGSGHTGGVVSVESGTEHTIEGNKGDEVRRCSYSTSSPSIIGYGRPKYYLLTGKITAADMPLVKKGSSGDSVKKLQEMLIAKGYSCGKYGADGDFGADTDSAVRKYQKDHGLTVDGEVGEKTWGSLFA